MPKFQSQQMVWELPQRQLTVSCWARTRGFLSPEQLSREKDKKVSSGRISYSSPPPQSLQLMPGGTRSRGRVWSVHESQRDREEWWGGEVGTNRVDSDRAQICTGRSLNGTVCGDDPGGKAKQLLGGQLNPGPPLSAPPLPRNRVEGARAKDRVLSSHLCKGLTRLSGSFQGHESHQTWNDQSPAKWDCQEDIISKFSCPTVAGRGKRDAKPKAHLYLYLQRQILDTEILNFHHSEPGMDPASSHRVP